MGVSYSGFQALRHDLQQGNTTCRNITEQYLRQIEAKNRQLNAFLNVFADEARQRADIIDQKLQNGTAGRLAGLVLAVKDNICYQDHPVRASSRMLGNFHSVITSTALQRLMDEDAIIIGVTNCDEFAMGSSNENSAFGNVGHPLNPEYVPGGSSGGSATAVAGGMCLASLGSDTGGSIRQPASFCGLVGLKPTYGRISRWGLIAYASSFDQIGSFTHNTEDAALLHEIMSGYDPNDNTTSTQPKATLGDYQNFKQDKYKIGVIRECVESEGLDPEIRNRTEKLCEQLKSAGHEIEYVSFPYLDYLIPVYYILTTAEASSNLARFDGVRYGFRDETAQSLEELYSRSRSIGFGREVKRRIMLGTFVLSAGYADAYYKKAQKIRRLLQIETQKILSEKGCDAILSPTAPTTAFKIGAKADDPISMYLSDIYTVHANLTGHPGVSVPVGLHSNGFPIGMHLLADYFDETRLLRIGELCMSLS
jgi:aspartyl-tRNA(Asn)/glutamyl-tRNA(Gln) amidotransferase subunit A